MSISAKPVTDSSQAWTPDGGLDGFEEEAVDEVHFASSSSDSTFDDVKASLEGKGASTDRLRPSDIYEEEGEVFVDGVEASDFDGKIFYRPNTWFSDLSEGERLEKMSLMMRLDSEYGVDFFGDPQSALISRDKKITKSVYDSKGVGTVEDYSLDEAFDLLDDGEEIVAKPRSGTCQGECVELIESSSELESYVRDKAGEISEEAVAEDLLLEEYLPTGEENENYDMRMVVVGDEVYRKERVDGDGIANNLDNNGEYSEPPVMSREELDLANKSKEIFGEGFYAVDYIRTEDGEVKVLENNATPGTKIEKELPVDLKDKIGDKVYNEDSNPVDIRQGYREEEPVL
ncbi:MAG: RimK family alpha-L-glutamate ligase [Candidatus Nanohalobium sp.]